MKLKSLILLALMGLWSISKSEKSCSCGKLSKAKKGTAKNSRIYNGRDAKNGQYPWHIYLKIVAQVGPDESYFNCGGSLISRKHILTAAHCFFDPDTDM